ncbi:MAG: sodium:solute symporter [Bacteroidales bacterium]|nr:sodium:solute symporter [Bacteroidales bacterium]
MSAQLILYSFLAYTFMLFLVSFITARKSDNESFFLGNRKSPWFVVAYGMIGASLSGVTFISVTGWVEDARFSYMMVVFGYLIGYFAIAKVLLPLYYRLQLTSIYTYLLDRFGNRSYKTGAFYFLLSRVIGASFRMFLVINVLQIFVFDVYGIPFWLTVVIFMALINLYTFKGGIKTIVWTDMVQTTFMLTSVLLTVYFLKDQMAMTFGELARQVKDSEYSQIVFTDWQDKHYFLKEFFSGAFIAIVMTGLDQDMMQKNLSCRNLRDAQKNIISLSWILVPVNFLFLSLGAALMIFVREKGIEITGTSDSLFPQVALRHLGPVAAIVFIIGLISAAYSSADSALTALTTSFSVDVLGINRRKNLSEKQRKNIRYKVHFGITFLLILVIVFFKSINNDAVISELFTVAGYTYGPLLGLFAFGLFTHMQVRDKWVPLVAIISPAFCYVLSKYSTELFNGYKFGFELLILNGLLTFAGLLMLSKKQD